MSPTIRIDDDVQRALISRSIPEDKTPNEVIRRHLGLAPGFDARRVRRGTFSRARDEDLQRRWRFFFEHAGYIVGRRAECALALARAERLLEAAVLEDVAREEWVDDEEPYQHGYYTDDEIAEKFKTNEWTGPFGCVLYIEGEHATSLGGITLGPEGPADPYARVVAAELAHEIEDDLRQALARLEGADERTDA